MKILCTKVYNILFLKSLTFINFTIFYNLINSYNMLSFNKILIFCFNIIIYINHTYIYIFNFIINRVIYVF